MAVFDPTLLRAKRIVDLSQLISADTATYPGDPSPRLEVLSTIDKGGANTTRIVLSAHAATHVDVPYHLLESGKTVDELPLEAFCGSALTYDLTHKALGSRICPGRFDDEDSLAAVRDSTVLHEIERSDDERVGKALFHLFRYGSRGLADREASQSSRNRQHVRRFARLI